MFKLNSVTFLCLSLCILVVNAGVVSFIDPCKWNDAECILKSSKKAKPLLVKGIPELGVASFDPLTLKDVNADNGELKLKLKDLTATDLSKCDIIKSERPEKLKYSLVLECPIKVNGKYKMGGKLAVIDVEGDGDFEIKTERARIEALFTLAKAKGKDGIEHYKFTSFDYKYVLIKKFFFKLTNLYNGDEAKAEPLLKVLDEGWKEIVDSIGKPLIKEMVVSVVHQLKNFLRNIPSNEFELP